MESMEELVQKVIEYTGIENEYQKFAIKSFWKEIMTEEISNQTRSLTIKKDTFCVTVTTAEAKASLESLKSDILTRLQKKFPRIPLSKIKISLKQQNSPKKDKKINGKE